MITVGPAFRDIANIRGMTATGIRVFLTSSNPKMPDLILTPEGDRAYERVYPLASEIIPEQRYIVRVSAGL